MPVKKKIVVIRTHEHARPIFVSSVTECTSEEIFKLQKQAKENLAELVKEYDERIAALEDQVSTLTKEVKYLKGEE